MVKKPSKKQINDFRDTVDDIMYGIDKINEVNKRKFLLDRESLGVAMASSTRNKIYNLIVDSIFLLKKDKNIKENLQKLERKIDIHINQLKKLEQTNVKENRLVFNNFLEWLYLANRRMKL